MADAFSVDTSEVEALSVQLGRASSQVIAGSAAVVTKGLLNIKTDTRDHISDDPSWKRLAQTVNYEQIGLAGEVGYDDVGQGELAGIYEFGSVHRAPHPTLYPAANREAPKFEAAMLDLATKVAP